MTATAERSEILLGSYAARSCPVKTHNDHRPDLQRPAPATGPGPVYGGGAVFVAGVLDRIVAGLGDQLVDLRQQQDETACRDAMATGIPIIVGGRLPIDHPGQRVGRSDLLIRGPDRLDGRASYHPVVVKGHKMVDRVRRREPAAGTEGAGTPMTGAGVAAVETSSWSKPFWAAAETRPGWALRRFRWPDYLQLAHYHRLLEAAGHAGDQAVGGVIGTDPFAAEPVIVWVPLDGQEDPEDLDHPKTSWLSRYDTEHDLRRRIAAAARQPTGTAELLVRPVVTRECDRCPWWEICRSRLDPDDISLQISQGALNRAEVTALRGLGVETTTDVLATDLEELLPRYLTALEEGADRSSEAARAESRLRTVVRRVRMLAAQVGFSRETTGPVELPTPPVEIDLDIESSADGRTYLWGFLVRRAGGPATYRGFARFHDLDAEGELELAREAFGWLRALVDDEPETAIYHYSGYEVKRIQELADRAPGDELFTWASTSARKHFVDLLETVRKHYFGLNGLGLKQIAQHAGFRWRDADPGGLNSQIWFADAVHGAGAEIREQARQRVLDYNEDDVRATAHLRAWLRTQA